MRHGEVEHQITAPSGVLQVVEDLNVATLCRFSAGRSTPCCVRTRGGSNFVGRLAMIAWWREKSFVHLRIHSCWATATPRGDGGPVCACLPAACARDRARSAPVSARRPSWCCVGFGCCCLIIAHYRRGCRARVCVLSAGARVWPITGNASCKR